MTDREDASSEETSGPADSEDRPEPEAGAEQEEPGEEEPERRTNYLVPDVDPWPLDSDEPIIELEDVYKSFGGEEVLKGLSLKIRPGEITVIIGSSGSGKSVLIKHMNGLFKPDKGAVRLFGESTSEMTGQQLDRYRKRIGTLFQNYALFDSMSVVDNVAFPLIEHNAMGSTEAKEHASSILEELGLGDALEKFPAELSGGMKKRVSLARALVTNPEVILFDEPTTGLDPIMMEFVDSMIEEITEDYSLTSVIISHDIASTLRLADSIAVLYDGKIIAHDDPQAVKESDDERVQSLIRGARKDEVDIEGAANEDLGDSDDCAIRITDLHKSFGGMEVLDGIEMRVPNNKITVVIGGSGEGKSVLMKHILRLLRPDSGTVEVFGQDVGELSEKEMRELRTQIGMLFQHAALFDSMTVAENVAFPLVERQMMSRSEAAERVDEILERLHISGLKDRFPPDISSGQKKRASLARALITEPPLIIYDEPTTGQDPMMTKEVEEMILEVQENFEVTSLVISHDMSLTFRIADHVALLADGKILAEGPPSELLHSEDERVHEFVFASEVGAHVD